MYAMHRATHLLLFSINKPQDFVNENSNICKLLLAHGLNDKSLVEQTSD